MVGSVQRMRDFSTTNMKWFVLQLLIKREGHLIVIDDGRHFNWRGWEGVYQLPKKGFWLLLQIMLVIKWNWCQWRNLPSVNNLELWPLPISSSLDSFESPECPRFLLNWTCSISHLISTTCRDIFQAYTWELRNGLDLRPWHEPKLLQDALKTHTRKHSQTEEQLRHLFLIMCD